MAFCAYCGTQISDQAAACPQCGHPTAARGVPAGVVVPNYLVQAILTTLFCCLPLGIVSIVYASQVNTKLGAGDVAGAQEASANAKRFAWISFGVGLGLIVLYLIFGAIGAMQTPGFGSF